MTIVAYDSLPKIAYVLKHFPRLSETFLRNEIHELERRKEMFRGAGPRRARARLRTGAGAAGGANHGGVGVR